MATAEQIKAVQDAYFAVNRATLNSTVAASVADAIAQGTTSLDAYIAAQIQSTASTTGAAVAISSFITGVAPTSDKLTALKAEADKQVASYTALKVGNPALGAFEAFGRSFATDADTTAAFNTKYGSLSGADFINAVYFQVYGTAPSAGAFANLSGQLSYFNTILANVPNAALAAKGAVLGQIVGYAFISDASANSTLDNQVATFLTAAAKGDTSGFGKALPTAGNDGQSFSLTVSGPTGQPDVKVGGAANDTFNGLLVGSLETGDQLDGKGGNDILNANLQGAANVQPQLLAIETLNFSNTGAAGAVDLTSAQGYTNVNIVNANVGGASGVQVNAINSAAAVKLGVENVANTSVGAGGNNYTFAFQNAALAGTADVVDLTVKNVGTATGTTNALAPVLNITGGAGATNGVETLNIHATGNARFANVNVVDDFAALAPQATLKTVTVDGSGNFRTNGIDFAGVTGTGTFDASKATGNINVTFNGTDDLTVTGGTGNDRFNLQGSLTAADKVDGGAGTDILAVTNNGSIVTGLQLSNFETIEVAAINVVQGADAQATLHLERVAGVTSAIVTGAQAGNASITGLASNGSVEFQTAGAGVITANVTGATTAGTNDTLNVTLNNAGTAGSGVVRGGLIANGVENIVINSVSQSTAPANNLVNAINLNPGVAQGANALENVTVKGTQDLNLGTINANAKTVNAADFTGDLTVTVAAGTTTNGVALTGGAGDDILVGGSSADVIVTGAGNNVVRGDVTGVAVPGTAQVNTLNIGAAETGDVFTVVIDGITTTYTWNGAVTDQANLAAFATAIDNNVPNVVANSATDPGVNNDGTGTITLTGAGSGQAFVVNSVASTNRAASNQVTTFTAPQAVYDAGDAVTVNINGVAITGNIGTDTNAAGANTALVNAVNANATLQGQGITATLNADGTASVTRTAGNTFTVALVGDGVGTEAPIVREQETVTFGGAPTAASVFTAQIGGKAYTLTGQADATDYATQLVNFINGDTGSTGLSANSAAGVVTILGRTTGESFNAASNNLTTNDTTKVTVAVSGAGTVATAQTVNGDFVHANDLTFTTTAAQTAGANTQSITNTQTTAPIAQVIGLGAADTITLSGTSNAVQYGSGNESGFTNAVGTVVVDTINGLNLGGANQATRHDVIDLGVNGFQTGVAANNTDVLGAAAIQFGGNAITVVNGGQAQALSAAPTFTAAITAVFGAGGALNTAVNSAGLFTYGTDTYLIVTDGAAGYQSGQDLIVKVTGLTGTLDSTDFV